ncbi:MAG: ShlB/FhaC/HecB family hemolysin secretion/activation protein [Parashewanella sp.]
MQLLRCINFCAVLFCVLTSRYVCAKDDTDNRFRIDRIIVQNHNIFSESGADTIFIHRWANQLHTNTQVSVILDSLNFKTHDVVDIKQLQESQRILRRLPYISDAKVYVADKNFFTDQSSHGKTIIVETWDNWSLLPTLNFSHRDNENKYTFGAKEDNLLGLGVGARLNYQSGKDRSGYLFAMNAPLKWIEHGNVSSSFYNNNDGKAFFFDLDKPFYALDTRYSFSVNVQNEIRIDTIMQNGQDLSQYRHRINFVNSQFGWMVRRTDNSAARLLIGVTRNEHEFTLQQMKPIPMHRDDNYIWLGYEYLQDDFEVLRNIRFINKNEDINLGWHHRITFGVETENVRKVNVPGYHVNWVASKGSLIGAHLWLMRMQGFASLATKNRDFYRVDLLSEYFHHFNDKWIGYGRGKLTFSKNLPLDMLNSLGDEEGIRGFPDDYQHGDNTWQARAELRYIPNINLYQLADLGWVVFTDIGKASGGRSKFNSYKDVIASIGIGARIYSSKSSFGNVAHIDLVYPFSKDPKIGGFEWRFIVRSHF